MDEVVLEDLTPDEKQAWREDGLRRLQALRESREALKENQATQLDLWVKLSSLGVKATVLANVSGVSDAAVSQALKRHHERTGATR